MYNVFISAQLWPDRQLILAYYESRKETNFQRVSLFEKELLMKPINKSVTLISEY